MELTSIQAFEVLQHDRLACLIDVRTEAEFLSVGIPDLSACQALLIQCSLYNSPNMEINSNFKNTIIAELAVRNFEHLLFLCRSGGRSGIAARMFADLGYKCYNIIDGFEGKSEGENMKGWKKLGLPWRIST